MIVYVFNDNKNGGLWLKYCIYNWMSNICFVDLIWGDWL